MGYLAREATLGLAMIMKNETANLAKSLLPPKGLLDEMVVVDTGSSDQSRLMAGQAGARVLDFEWSADFAAARNFGLAAASTDFILWLDADNSIKPEGLLEFRRHLVKGAEVILWATEVVTPQGDRLWQKRVFPNRPDVFFEGRVHEQLVHPAGFKSLTTGVEIQHWGYAEPLSARKKGERNLELLLSAPETLAGEFYWLYQTGRTLLNLRRFEDAAGWLTRAAGRPTGNQNLLAHNLILLSQAQARLGLHHEAEKILRDFLATRPDYGPVLYQLGRLLYDGGRKQEAAECLEAGLVLGLGDPVWGADPRLYNFRAAFILGRIWAESGRRQSARQAFLLAREIEPENPEPVYALAEVAASDGDGQQARQYLAHVLHLAPGHRRAMNLFERLRGLPG